MKIPDVITIDGPAASGKSSVGKIIADKLNYMFLDTGIMYRAVTWAVLDHGVDVSDEKATSKVAEEITIEILPPDESDGGMNRIFVDEKDISDKIRNAEVNENVSQVSKYKIVRQVLTRSQQKIGACGGIVMAGRDIGTVVMPQAELKVFLEASVNERARRRYSEEVDQGKKISLEDVVQNVSMRDRIDSNREIAPLIPAEDAHIIQTDGKTIEEVVREVMKIIEMA